MPKLELKFSHDVKTNIELAFVLNKIAERIVEHTEPDNLGIVKDLDFTFGKDGLGNPRKVKFHFSPHDIVLVKGNSVQ
ncbi:MAG: hypothetical protein ACREHG_00125 [Candidatus Saccharimonadales bacterium]